MELFEYIFNHVYCSIIIIIILYYNYRVGYFFHLSTKNIHLQYWKTML